MNSTVGKVCSNVGWQRRNFKVSLTRGGACEARPEQTGVSAAKETMAAAELGLLLHFTQSPLLSAASKVAVNLSKTV